MSDGTLPIHCCQSGHALAQQAHGLNLAGDDAATSAHMENFANAIRTGEALRLGAVDLAHRQAPHGILAMTKRERKSALP